jgi:hypothetical protein
VTVATPDNAESGDLASDGELPRAFRLESYAHLLKMTPHEAGIGSAGGDRTQGTPRAGSVIDAIIVPTIRDAEQLRPAIRLAKQLRCQLIALYTDKFPERLTQALAELRPGQATVLALRPGAGHRLLDLASALPQGSVSACAADISRKRNLGLLIGRACGWTRMLFLDDDIRRLNADKVSSAAALLSQYPVVGLQVTKFADASVVGHARRLAESGWRPFISGGSMLVNPQRMRGFFPPVYHEDWLSIIDHLLLSEVAIAGRVAQLRYQPFTTERRAQLEEFGDILASGLLWLACTIPMDERNYWQEATKLQFWRDILQQRATLLESLSKRLEGKTLALKSIQAAQTRCKELSPTEFVSFIEKWLDSLVTWRARLEGLPKADSVAKALAQLGLLHVVTTHDEPRSRVRAAARRLRRSMDTAGFPKPVPLIGLLILLPGLRRFVRAESDQ